MIYNEKSQIQLGGSILSLRVPAFIWLLVSGFGVLLSTLTLLDGLRSVWAIAGIGLLVVLLTWNRQTVVASALVFFVGCVALIPTTNLPGNDILRILVPSVCLVAALIALLRRGSTVKRPSGTALAIVILFLILFIATSFYSEQGTMEALRTYAFLAIPAVVLAENLNAIERVHVFRFLVILAVVQALLCWFEFAFLSEPLWGAPVSPLTGLPSSLPNELFGSARSRAQGTLGHPLVTSLFMAVGLALNVAGKSLWPKLVRWFLSLIILSAALPNGSRSGLLIMGGLTIFLMGGGKVVAKAARVLAITAIASLFAGELGLFKSTAVESFFGSGSVTHRAGAFEAVPRLLGQDLAPLIFGNGFLSKDRMFRSGLLQLDGFAAVDNQFVLTLSEAGVIGAVILIAILVAALKIGSPESRAALLALMTMMFIFDVMSWASTVVLFAVLIGLCSSSASSGYVNLKKDPGPSLDFSAPISPAGILHR